MAICAGASAAPHPFDVHDLVMLDRVSDPQLSPDGKWLAYQLRETDYAANKGINSLWLRDLRSAEAKPVQIVNAEALTAASSPRWSPDGRYLYFLAQGKSAATTQVWRIATAVDGKIAPVAVTTPQADVNAFKLSPDGRSALLAIDTPERCADFACVVKAQDEKPSSKASGRVYDRLFIRHWDTWANDKRSQLYIADIDAAKPAAPRMLSRGIDGDVPSKPFGDDGEFAFSPDGKSVYFDVRIAGKTEPWSTNFDIYSVAVDGSGAPKNLTAANAAWDAHPLPSADGKTLYYLAMKRPTFEADRFAIIAMDLATGSTREIDPKWDRSAGNLALSADGKTLFATADDNGEHPLFAVDIVSGKVSRIAGAGSIHAFTLAGDQIVFARTTLKTPTDFFRVSAKGGNATALSHANAAKLAEVRTGDFESFVFKGANDEEVQGWLVKPVDFDKNKKYPVAYLIHGGPQGAFGNDWSYRWNPQTYAGQGFAVVMVNFHGSTGYGQAFTDAISGDWGGKPLVDLQKGWDAALQKYSFLDGGRACALGASYGGYMVYWIAGNWPQPWKCLVDHDGVFDNRMMGYATEELWFSEWENGGTPWDHAASHEKFNPILHVKDWRVPMLVVHSEKDFRIPVEQGIAAFTALQRRGIPSKLLTFPDENHWVLKPQNSVLWHDTVNAWIKQWTGG
ncbi:MAG: S9 family peptidase [Rudaea sp.]